jgi:hypothetical protein
MRRWARAIAALSLVLPLILYAALRMGLLTPVLNLIIAGQLGSRTPVQARLGSLRSDIFSYIEIDDVVVLAPSGSAKLPLLTLSSLRLEYKGWAAIRGQVGWEEALSLARIRGLNIFLLRQAGGAWNVPALDAAPQGAASGKKDAALPVLPAARVELEDSRLVLNDESRGFNTSIDRLQGSLDARALPLLTFSLHGRTEGKEREDLSLAGELDQRDAALRGRLDLDRVELARYLNYLLPGQGLRFEDGTASLSVRLRRAAGGQLSASGRAELHDGALRIPGISEPLSGLQGAVAFDPGSLRFQGVRARFLDSEWTATGAIHGLAQPRFDVQLESLLFPLQSLSSQVAGMGQLGLSGTATVQATLQGPVDALEVTAQVQAPDMRLLGAEVQAVSTNARLVGSRLEVRGLAARLWGGSLQATASMDLAPRGRLEASLQLQQASLLEARLDGVRALPLSGTADLALKAEGLLRDPQVGLLLRIAQGSLGSLDLGSMEAEAEWGPAGLKSRFSGAAGRLTGTVNVVRGKGARFEGSSIQANGLDVAQALHGLATAEASMGLPASAVELGGRLKGRLAGSLSAVLTLEGTIQQPSVWMDLSLREGRLFLEPGPWGLREAKQGLPVLFRGALGFEGGDMRLGREGRPLRLAFNRRGRSLELLALGRYPLTAGGASGRLELALEGDLRILDAFEAFSDGQGRLRADLMLAGTLDAPLAQGELSLTGFAVKPSRFLAPLRGGELQMEFKEQRIELVRLGISAGGQLEAKGSLDLSAGWKGMHGSLELRTDERGLRLQNWESMGSGDLALTPLTLSMDGEGAPYRLKGRARLSNALVTYAGRERSQGPALEEPEEKGRDWDLDLRVALGPNVWYEKRNTGGVEIFDPSRWISGTIESVQQTFQQPAVFFRLRPTDQDISVRRQLGALQLGGVLTIDRGRLTLMENDFEIRPERRPAVLRFNGKQAEVSAEAVGRLRYSRDNPLTGRPQQRAVDVVITVEPLRPEELERSDLADAFLNYSLRFSAEPAIPDVSAAQQESAILNLVVLGDPLLDLQQLEGRQDSASRLTEAQLNRLISGEAKRQLAKWSRRGLRFMGTPLVDVLRVVPRFSYQSSARTGATTVGQASDQAQESNLVFSDLTVEVGKSLSEHVYASVLWVRFGESGISAATSGLTTGNQVVRDSGLRAGLELQINANRSIEAFYSYSLDDNLQPKPFDPRDLWQAHSGVLRIRNTIPTANYSPRLARERRWDGLAED